MTRVAVDPAGLAEWSADAGLAHDRLTRSVSDTDTVVSRMSAAWDGEAAQHFDQRYRQWRGAADHSLGTLGVE